MRAVPRVGGDWAVHALVTSLPWREESWCPGETQTRPHVSAQTSFPSTWAGGIKEPIHQSRLRGVALPRILGLPVLAGLHSCLWGMRPRGWWKSRGRPSHGMSVGLGSGPAGIVVNPWVWPHPFPGTPPKLCPLLSCRLGPGWGGAGGSLVNALHPSPPPQLINWGTGFPLHGLQAICP